MSIVRATGRSLKFVRNLGLFIAGGVFLILSAVFPRFFGTESAQATYGTDIAHADAPSSGSCSGDSMACGGDSGSSAGDCCGK